MSEANVQTQEFFTSYAGDFNAIYSSRNGLFTNVINKTLRKSMRLRFVKTLDACQPIAGRTVLDVGCGPGHYGIALALRGAGQVTGIDFASGMIELAKRQAKIADVAENCEFLTGDFTLFKPAQVFDYVVVMGVMDYIEKPRPFVERVVELTNRRAMFSLPVGGGFLAWQRQLRYKKRCPLYFYDRASVEKLFTGMPGVNVRVDKIARDFFVTLTKR
jgi:2-polyprenyl-3-methyl-5-hydroxy-6-metoxy-1,4-benzoquinol methylase